MSRTIAVADVGGTHARFALADIEGSEVRALGEPVTLKTAAYASFEEAWQAFGQVAGAELPPALGLAAAGPVGGEVLKLTNNPWSIRPALMDEQLGVRHCKIVNDFGAIAHAVAQLDAAHFDHLSGPAGPMPSEGVTTVIGPGTGLGVAQLLKRAESYEVIETEGGHIDFAPLDELDDRILSHLRSRFGRVSVERVASGAGLPNIYHAMGSIEGGQNGQADPEQIWTVALDGTDSLAAAALERLFMTLGSAAGDFALAHGANAVVIAGGLGYRLKDRFATSGFTGRYLAKGRFERRMASIPVKLLTHPQPGLYGAAAAFAQEFA